MTLRLAVGALMALSAVNAGATAPPPLRLPEKALAAEHYTYVTKTALLPKDIREGLARQLEQRELQMADAGTPFNVGDAILDPSLPAQRLILAAVGDKYAVVHFERGGVAHVRRIVLFERTAAGLNVLLDTVLNEEYRQPKELAAAIATGALWKPRPRPAP